MPQDSRPGPVKNADPGGMVRADLRRQQALQMHGDGMTYQVIAQKLGCSRGYAFKLVNDGWAELAADNNEERLAQRAIEIERLERLIESLWSIATGDIDSLEVEAQAAAIENQIRAHGAISRHVQTICRLLGLYAPSKIEHTTKQVLEPLDELMRRVRESKANRAAFQPAAAASRS